MQRIVALVTAVMVALPLAVFAQEDDAVDLMSMSLDDLLNMEVSTAGKKAEKISEVPASMVVISKEEIQLYGYTSIAEIIENVPGFYSLGAANLAFGATNYGVRGFSTSSLFTTVMVMVNGVNQMEDQNNMYNLDALGIPLSSINRIEIVRGPMAVMYGSNAFLGAINIITDGYDENEKSEVFVVGGALNTVGGGGYVSGAEGDLKFKATVNYSSSDGMDIEYADVMSNPMNQIIYTGGAETTTEGKLSRESFYTGFNGKYNDFSADMTTMRYVSGNFAFLPSVSEDGFVTTMEQSFFKFGYDPTISDNMGLGLKYITSLTNWGGENIALFDPAYIAMFSAKTTSHEFEANMNYSLDKFDIGGGIGYRVVPTLERYTDLALPVFTGLNLPGARIYLDDPFATKSVYTQANYDVTGKLKLTAGLRIEHTDDYSLSGVMQTTGGMGQDSSYAVAYLDDVKQGGVAVIPRLAAVFKVNDQNICKLLYGNSKKRASFSESVPVSVLEPFDLGLADMNTVELNYLTTVSKLKSTANVSVFYNTMTGLPVNTLVIDTAGGGYQNTTADGELKTVGVEASVKFSPSNKFNAELAVSYQKNTDESEGFDTVDVAFTPEILGYFKTYYRITDKISVGLKTRYVSEMLSEYDVVTGGRYGDETPSYILLDLNLLAVDIFHGLGASAYVSNVLDEEVRYPTNNNCSWVDKGMLGYGRRISGTLFYQF